MTTASREQAELSALLYNNLGILIGPQVRASGIAMLRRAVMLNPLDPVLRLNLASHLASAGEDDEPFELLARVLAERPDDPIAWDIMGCLATRRGELDSAIECYERAFALDGASGQREFNLAAAYLRRGAFGPGLEHYEARLKLSGTLHIQAPGVPAWDGAARGHVCVIAEQGVGDKIMFARFLPWVRERAGQVTFLTDPGTLTLFAGYASVGTVAMAGARVDCDYQIPLASLPRLYGLAADNVPADPGLLNVAETSDALRAPGALKIGIVWAGNEAHPNDDIRSIAFSDFLPLTADPRNAVFSLQCGPRSADIATARAQRLVTDLSGNIEGEWTHTAAAIRQMDLIVCADTAVGHLAAALDKPVFMLIARFSDWRWLWGRDDTPWYPAMRLFRQQRVLQWRPVVARVMQAIADIHRDRALEALRPLPAPVPAIGTAGALTVDGVYEPDIVHLMERVLRPGDCFVDVGANVGVHTLRAAELVGRDGCVLAFEPGIESAGELRRSLAARDLCNVSVVQAPVWSKAETVTFHLCADGGHGNALWDPGLHPANELSRQHVGTLELQATTLDDWLGARWLGERLRGVRLIKIDVEGAEQRVLEGAEQTFRALRPPFIVAELHEFGLRQLGCSQASLRELMQRHGYGTFLLPVDGSRPRLLADDVEITGPWIVNLLFSTEAADNAYWPQQPSGPAEILTYVLPGAESAA
jgi:FkbM family methyltransferase